MSINEKIKNIKDIYKDSGFIEGIHYSIEEKNKKISISMLGVGKDKSTVYSLDESITLLKKIERTREKFIADQIDISGKYFNKNNLSQKDFEKSLKDLIKLENYYVELLNKIPDSKDYSKKLENVKSSKYNYLDGYKNHNKEKFYIGSLYEFNYRDCYDRVSSDLDTLINKRGLSEEKLNDVELVTSLYEKDFYSTLKDLGFYKENRQQNLSMLSRILRNSLIDRNIIKKEGVIMSEKIERTDLVNNPKEPNEKDVSEVKKDEDGKKTMYIHNVELLISKMRELSNWKIHVGLDIKRRNYKSNMKEIRSMPSSNRRFKGIEEGMPILILGESPIAVYDKDSRKLLNFVTDNDIKEDLELYNKYLDYKEYNKAIKDFSSFYDLKTYIKAKYGVEEVFPLKVKNEDSKNYGKIYIKVGNDNIIGELKENSADTIKYTYDLEKIDKIVKDYKEKLKSESKNTSIEKNKDIDKTQELKSESKIEKKEKKEEVEVKTKPRKTAKEALEKIKSVKTSSDTEKEKRESNTSTHTRR